MFLEKSDLRRLPLDIVRITLDEEGRATHNLGAHENFGGENNRISSQRVRVNGVEPQLYQ